jgi:hypothetical protein
MNKTIITALFAVVAIIPLCLTQTAKGQSYWIGTGASAVDWDWEAASNWQDGNIPGRNEAIYIQNGGVAAYSSYTFSYYCDRYGIRIYEPSYDDPQLRFGNITIANHSALYLDSVIDFNYAQILLDNNSTLDIGISHENYGTLTEIRVNGNSTINAELKGFDKLHAYKITGDGTGTINITDIPGRSPAKNDNNGIELNNINIHSEVSGTSTVIVEHLSGIGNLTVASGAMQIGLADDRVGGNTTIANGSKLSLTNSYYSIITVNDGYNLSGGGTVELRGETSVVRILSGGSLDTSITLNAYANNTPFLVLEDGAILTFMEGSPLTILGANFGIDTLGTVFVDFSNVSLAGGNDYVIIDWTGVTNMQEGSFDVNAFTVSGEGVKGTFSVQASQLVFHATAVPEPSTWFLLGTGLGILLLTSRRRRNVQS